MEERVILIADDDENDVFLFKRALSTSKILNPVHVVDNGEAAIHYLNGEGIYKDRLNYPFPIFLALNLQMPRRNGTEVLAWLQSHPELPDLKVLVVSGLSEPRQVVQAHHLGAEHFLQKPARPDQLRRLIERIGGLKLIPHGDGFKLDLVSWLIVGLCTRTLCAVEPILHF